MKPMISHWSLSVMTTKSVYIHWKCIGYDRCIQVQWKAEFTYNICSFDPVTNINSLAFKSSLPDIIRLYPGCNYRACVEKLYCLFFWHRTHFKMRLLNWRKHFLTCCKSTFKPNLLLLRKERMSAV